MARLETAIKTFADVFAEYAGEGGKKKQLDAEELKRLLVAEIQCPLLKDKINPGDIDEAMNTMDKNSDGTINIREFCRSMFVLVKAYYRETYGKGKRNKEGAEA